MGYRGTTVYPNSLKLFYGREHDLAIVFTRSAAVDKIVGNQIRGGCGSDDHVQRFETVQCVRKVSLQLKKITTTSNDEISQ